MEKEIDGLISELQEHLKDSTRRTHKMLINTISAITVHLDRDQISKKEHFTAIAEMVLTLICYPYEQNKTNLELIVRLLSQMVLRLGNKLDYIAYIEFIRKILAIFASTKHKLVVRLNSTKILFCILKFKHEVVNFPNAVFKEVYDVTLKVLTSSKEHNLTVFCLIFLQELIKSDWAKDGTFMELANQLLDYIKGKHLIENISAVKCLLELIKTCRETKLQVGNLRKIQKQLEPLLKEQINNSELRRHAVMLYFESMNLIFWTEHNIEPKRRVYDETNSKVYLKDCFAHIKGLLPRDRQSKHMIYNCFELLIMVIDKSRFYINSSHIEFIFELIIFEASRVADDRLAYALRDIFGGYFFENLMSLVPEPMIVEIFDQTTNRLQDFKQRLNCKDDIIYTLLTKKPQEGMGSAPKVLVEVYLKVWYRCLKIFGHEVQEKISDHSTLLHLLCSYLYSSDKFIKNSAIQCMSVYSGLNLECLDRTMGFLIEQKTKLSADAEVLVKQENYEPEKLSSVLQRLVSISRAIGKTISKFSKDFFEVNKDYILVLLNECSEQIRVQSVGLCQEVLAIDLARGDQVYKTVCLSNNFWLLASILHMSQKWLSLHKTNILKPWQDFYTNVQGKVSLPATTKPEENHFMVQILINFMYSILIFVKNCRGLWSDNLLKILSSFVIKLYTSNFTGTATNIESHDKTLLKTIIYQFCNIVDPKWIQPIQMGLLQTCFNELNENSSCFQKVPSQLLDEEEERLIRIFLADKDYYTVVFPDSLDRFKLEKDNIEFNPYYGSENLIVSNSSVTQKNRLSECQLEFIERHLPLKSVTRKGKMKILEFIEMQITSALKIEDRLHKYYRVQTILFSILSILNSVLVYHSQGVQLEDMELDNQFIEKVINSVQECWSLQYIELRITCGLIYAKVLKLAEPANLPKYTEKLLERRNNIDEMPTIIITLGFMYKYNTVETLAPIQLSLSNIFIHASRSKENELSSNWFLYIAISLGFKYNKENFLPIFNQFFQIIMLHYLEVANTDPYTFWAMSEWMGVYLTNIVSTDEKKLGEDLKVILFDHYRTLFSNSYPVINYSKFNLMKAIFTCPGLASSYSCFRNQEIKILEKLRKERTLLKKSFFRESEIADMDTAELLVDSLHRIKVTGLEISFIILNNLNNLNYQLISSEQVKTYIKSTYQSTLNKLVDSNNVKMEEILFFYQNALSPTNYAHLAAKRAEAESASQQKSVSEETVSKPGKSSEPSYSFNRPILSETQDFINYTFENLLQIINIVRFQPTEILEFSNLVFPFIFRTASSSAKSNREHSIPMLLYVMEKMVDFNEKGYKISPEQPDQSSLVNNFAAHIQAILRFNFQSEQNNSSNTMKKIYEIFYLFFKISYKTDKELFTSQFNMFLDPMYNLLQTKSRDDSISRLKVLSKIIYELSESKSTRNDVLELLARKGNSHKQMLLIFEGFIQDTSSIILSSNSQSNQSEVLTIKIINDKLDMSLYLDTIKHVIASYCSVHIMQGEPLPSGVQQTCKFILSYMLAIDTTSKHILNSFDKPETKSETHEAERYFSSRRDVVRPFNLLVAAGVSFTADELLYFYRVFVIFVKIGSPEDLRLIKEFCFIALKSDGIPKDRALLELISEFPPEVVKVSSIMAGLHKAISQVVHKTEIADIDLDHAADFDLEEMGLKVVQRYIDESVHETELVAEIRKNLQTIMDLDFCLSDTKLLTEIVSHYHRGSPNSALIFVPLLAKLEPEVGKKLLNELLKSQFDFVYQSLQEFFKLTLEWDVTKFQHKELVLEVYEMLFSSLFVGLAAKKAENIDKRVEMLLRCLSIFATLCSKIGDQQNKKIVIQMIFGVNDYMVGRKISMKFFEETVLKILETEDKKFAQELRSTLKDEHAKIYDSLTSAIMEKFKAKEIIEKATTAPTAVGMKFALKPFKKA